MRHAVCYLVCNLALWPLWLGWLRPEQLRCTEQYTATALRNTSGNAAMAHHTTASLQAAAEHVEAQADDQCAAWKLGFMQAAVALCIRALASLIVAHWVIDGVMLLPGHARQIARQQRLTLLPAPCPLLPEALSYVLVLFGAGGVFFLWISLELGRL